MEFRPSFAVLLSSCALLVPAAGATAAPVPPVYCDPGACIDADRVQRIVDGQTAGVQECLAGAGAGLRAILNGTPQPQECNL